MSVDSYVGVAEPSTPTKKIRNISVQILQPDGTLATVLMQVVSIADAEGIEIDLDPEPQTLLLRQILAELRVCSYLLMTGLNVRDSLESLRAAEGDLASLAV